MTNFKDRTIILAGDIGGTKTNLSLFTRGKRRPLPKVIETFSSQKALDLEHIIRQFLGIHPASVTHACFGVAGPVVNGKSKTTNLPWNVSETKNFINSSEVVVIPEQNKILLSEIFNWYSGDFGKGRDVLEFVLSYLKSYDLAQYLSDHLDTIEVEYLFYDWNLNH